MVVNRRGSSLVKKEIRDLGKLLVTIDGLQALRDEVERLDGGSRDPVMEFNGGTFDETEDLRTLSDLELQQLTVKGDAVEVHLSQTSAQAVGDPTACEAVYNQWARLRQTKQRATRAKRIDILFAVVFGFGALLFAVPAIIFLLDPSIQVRYNGVFQGFATPTERYRIAVFAIGVCAFFVFCIKLALAEHTKSYAVVRAFTEDEYRKERATAVRHWQNATIALATVSATLLVGFLTLLFKK